jgi:hypothetical protein
VAGRRFTSCGHAKTISRYEGDYQRRPTLLYRADCQTRCDRREVHGRWRARIVPFFKTPAGLSQYVQQHAIDVGYVPSQRARVYEIHSTYTNEALVYDWVTVKEGWTRAITGYADRSERSSGYRIALLENGDKIFSRFELTTQATVSSDGSKSTKSYSVTTLAGGTGKFKGIHCALRGITDTDFKNRAGAVPKASTGKSGEPADSVKACCRARRT